ncbi:MAG: sigma-54-dependent Fis family transcriptional regulator [Bacteroidetes bacterium]|jgi:DNA-binding NtrC family response regulator|nr:sigma-54-dependent Fis family transcriptional regulator [Bacteroidota bacterium]
MTDSAIKIFIIEDDMFYSKLLKSTLDKVDRYDVRVFGNGTDAIQHLYEKPDIITIDHNLPDMSGIEILRKVREYDPNIVPIYMSGQDEIQVVVQAYKDGAKDYIMKEENAVLLLQKSLENIAENLRLKREIEELRDKAIEYGKYSSIIGESPAMHKVIRLMEKVANTDLTVLITGESGTGKEVIANALHYNSNRKRKPFVAVNMGAIPIDLVESELFGHERGSFTGASSKRIGRFEEADGGTIFLDEIAEMDMSLQAKLLRVLQEKSIQRVGGSKTINLDIRIIAATNKILADSVKEGKFREDLYYRLQGFLIKMPPLRERGNDIIILANYFKSQYAKNTRQPELALTGEAARILMQHTWPGNVRELKSVVERAIIISDNDKIETEDLIFSDSAM